MLDRYKTINISSLKSNVNLIKKFVKKCKLCAVIKSNAYGHGAEIVCKNISSLVDYFAVSNNYEAIKIRTFAPSIPCLILSPVSKNGLDEAIFNNAIFSVQNIEDLILLEHRAKRLNKIAYYHLQINSGMNRYGLTENVSDFYQKAPKLGYTKLVGVYSHLGSGDTPLDPRCESQKRKFNELTQSVPSNIIRHLCNTKNTFTHPDCHFDMVRCGAGLYGYDNENLRPVMQIFAKIIAIQNVGTGDYIGYGNGTICKKPTRVAVLSIGYAHGLPRLWAKPGYVLLNNKKVKIIGNICMEATFIDVSNVPAKIGDYATILGNGEALNAEIMAKESKTIPDEILTNFSQIPLKIKNKKISNKK